MVMVKRKPVVGLSLKNYINSMDKTEKLCDDINHLTGKEDSVEQFLFPSLGTLSIVAKKLQNSQIGYGAQNISPFQNGAYTGEFSIETLLDISGGYVEIGHHERITIFRETPEMTRSKIRLALNNSIVPIVCIGEGQTKVDFDSFKYILTDQIESYFGKDVSNYSSKIILAYEPGWAIGKVKAANADFVHEAHRIIREIWEKLYGKPASEKIRIIYGGSVSEKNSSEIVSNNNVDGVFIGRFGHDPSKYAEIVSIVKTQK